MGNTLFQAGNFKPKTLMVFDAESIGLHGEVFAVGWCQINLVEAAVTRMGRIWCPSDQAWGRTEDREWVKENVPKIVVPFGHGALDVLDTPVGTPREVRELFWNIVQGVDMVAADCPFPVESRFLNSRADDLRRSGNHLRFQDYTGPYPLVDVASVLLAVGMDPLASYDRREYEPLHDPLGDSLQSARMLLKAFDCDLIFP